MHFPFLVQWAPMVNAVKCKLNFPDLFNAKKIALMLKNEHTEGSPHKDKSMANPPNHRLYMG